MALTQVGTDGIKDDAVTLDKRAGVARGKLIVGDASGNPAALAKGSAGQVLKHDGNDIAWGAVPAAGIGADAIDGTKIADDSIDSEHIVDGSVDHAHLANDCVDADNIADDGVAQAAIADEAVDEARLQISNAGSNGQFLSKQSGNTGGLTWATVLTEIADDSLTEAKLDISNAPTDGHFLKYKDSTDKLTWSAVTIPKLDAPSITGDLEVADGGTVTHTISNWSDDVSYTFSSLSNCTIGTVNASGQFVVTETGDNPSYTVKATTDSLGLDDSTTTTKQLKTRLSAPTLSSPADDGTATNIVYTITSTNANDNKLILDIGSSNFTYQSVSHGSGSKVGNTVEVTGFTTNNPAVTIQFTAEATYSVTAKAVDTNGTWGDSVASSADSITIQNSYTVDYLVVAGGGGGGRGYGGGGGAGGLRASFNSETSGGGGSSETALQMVPGTEYTVTVGGGGSGGHNVTGTSGSDSEITGSDITDVTSLGGGRGGSRGPNSGQASGGSGGGAPDGHPGGPGQTGAAGTANQGSPGGNGIYGSNHYNGGGGGGASATGGNAQIGSPGGGPGGAGQASTIIGSSTTYAGGGGGGMGSGQGGNTPGGPGGSGGGGSGGSDGLGSPGSTNLGGGGGGSGNAGNNWGPSGGGSGGSGVVILRMATSNYSSTTSGSPTVTTSGSDTILKYTGDGSYTA